MPPSVAEVTTDSSQLAKHASVVSLQVFKMMLYFNRRAMHISLSTISFCIIIILHQPPRHNRCTAFFWDHPGEQVPEENFQTLWCKGRLTEADTQTIRMGATPSDYPVPTSTIFLQAGCPSCRSTNSVKALKATSAYGLGRRC